MDKKEFINKMIGVPWKNRAHSFDEVDCYGLVVMYYKHVIGHDIILPKGYESGSEKSECFSDWQVESGFVETRSKRDGNIVAMFSGGRLSHVGVMTDSVNVLHCRGDLDSPGHVEAHTLRSLSKFFTTTKIYMRG